MSELPTPQAWFARGLRMLLTLIVAQNILKPLVQEKEVLAVTTTPASVTPPKWTQKGNSDRAWVKKELMQTRLSVPETLH